MGFCSIDVQVKNRRVNGKDDPLPFILENQLWNRHSVVNSLLKCKLVLVFSSPLFISYFPVSESSVK